jgi:hypothetical protein
MMEVFNVIIIVAATIFFVSMIYEGIRRVPGSGPVVAFVFVLLIIIGLTT